MAIGDYISEIQTSDGNTHLIGSSVWVSTEEWNGKTITEVETEIKTKFSNLTEITWSSLKSLVDTGSLIPGMQYRITDYTCTTTQSGTKSAGHVFDIIVTADDKSTLNEVARAAKHDGDTYFANNDLSAWKLWYSFDNDASRFTWAMMSGKYITIMAGDRPKDLRCPSETTVINGVTYYLIFYRDGYYIGAKSLEVGASCDLLFDYNGSGLTVVETDAVQIMDIKVVVGDGKGVIYRMIDEFDNDCPYDFKNIQFYRQWDEAKQLWSTISQGAVGVPCYTFSSEGDSSAIEFTDRTLMSSSQVYGNTINASALGSQTLNNNCFFGDNCNCNTLGYDCNNNTFGNDCYHNTFGIDCINNTLRESCQDNAFGNYCMDNSFGNNCTDNTFGNNCTDNTFGNNCMYNTFGNDCRENIFDVSCGYNTFGYGCDNNTFRNGCHHNTFMNDCRNNTFGSYCENNIFRTSCGYNTFGNNCRNNTFGNNCSNNTFGNNCRNNTFGNNCYYIKFASDKSASTKYDFYSDNHFGDGCEYIVFTGTNIAKSYNQVQNYNFAQGLQGTSSAYITIDGVRNRAYETKVAKNSAGELKVYCEADLIK